MKNPVTLKQAIKGKSRVHAAFSLIELLVVIAGIGIIAAIAIPNPDISYLAGNARNISSQPTDTQ
jgi:prepilin-type N-terminal cleavage/methylation domain-containing protein